jgi:hypothetical protein
MPAKIIYNTISKYGNITVSICLDIHSEDVKNRLKNIQSNNKNIPIDFLIVPAHHNKPDLCKGLCEEFNKQSLTCTILVNDKSNGQHNAVFNRSREVKLRKTRDNNNFMIQTTTIDTSEMRLLRSTVNALIIKKI